MTVKELIEHLKTFDGDFQVLVRVHKEAVSFTQSADDIEVSVKEKTLTLVAGHALVMGRV